jgi:hypothetical protein
VRKEATVKAGAGTHGTSDDTDIDEIILYYLMRALLLIHLWRNGNSDAKNLGVNKTFIATCCGRKFHVHPCSDLPGADILFMGQ